MIPLVKHRQPKCKRIWNFKFLIGGRSGIHRSKPSQKMGEDIAFEVVDDHEFKPREHVLVIDVNGYDLWEAVIKDVTETGFVIHYPEFEEDDETLPDRSRLLVQTKQNMRIFKQQEMTRAAILPPGSDGEEPEDTESENSESEDGYIPEEGEPDEKIPDNGSPKGSKGKGKKAKPTSKKPEWARSNPPRSKKK